MKDYYTGDMNAGEKALLNTCKELEDEEFNLLPNILIERPTGGSNQIDLMTISKKGIFVLEMKDFKGWIFGDENHKEWTQSLFGKKKGSKKYKFRNPIKQNANHIKTIRKLLSEKNLDNLPIYNVIVFSDDATLKDINASVDVVNLKDIKNVFNKYRDIVITTEEIKDLVTFLKSKDINSAVQSQEHIKYISNIKNQKDRKKDEYTKNKILVKDDHKKQKVSKKALSDHHNNSKNTMDNSQKFIKTLKVIFKDKKNIILLIFLLFLLTQMSYTTLTVVIIFSLIFAYFKFKNKFLLRLALYAFIIFLALKPDPSLVEAPLTMDDNHSDQGITQEQNNDQMNRSLETSTFNMETETDTDTRLDQNLKEETSNQESDESILKEQNEVAQTDSTEAQNKEASQEERAEEIKEVEKDQDSESTEEKNPIDSSNERAQVFRIMMGADKSQVEKYLGPPDRVNGSSLGETWYYRSSYLNFNAEGQIIGWQNNLNQLNEWMILDKNPNVKLHLGDTKADTLLALGSPTRIDPNRSNHWYYDSSEIQFSVPGFIIGWKNRYNNLDHAMYESKDTTHFIRVGISQEDVLDILGSPTEINPLRANTWHYDSSTITFDENKKVNGWNNMFNTLDTGLLKTSETFDPLHIGKTKEDVLVALGSPRKIDANRPNHWHYDSLCMIIFDETGLVSGWKNQYNKLDKAFYQEKQDSKYIEIGDKETVVLDALGSPDEINPHIPNRWSYGLSYITFDEMGLVNGWKNHANKLNHGFYQPEKTQEKIGFGSSKAVVTKVFGSPSDINAYYPNRWSYGLAWISFDENGLVNNWQDYNNFLKDKISD